MTYWRIVVAAGALLLASCETASEIARDEVAAVRAIPANVRRGFVVAPASANADGQTVYNASQCIGAIVNGVCHGTIQPDGGNHPICHGEMLNGQCTGPMF